MADLKITPGASARSAFRLGLLAAALGVLAAIGFFYWAGELTLLQVAYTLIVLFPVYLVFAASLLSVWLGYGKDASDLRPVYQRRGGS